MNPEQLHEALYNAMRVCLLVNKTQPSHDMRTADTLNWFPYKGYYLGLSEWLPRDDYIGASWDFYIRFGDRKIGVGKEGIGLMGRYGDIVWLCGTPTDEEIVLLKMLF